MENNVKRNIIPFNGERYNIWKTRLCMLLSEKDLKYVIDDETPIEPNRRWNKDNNKTKNLIAEYLSDSYLNFVTPHNTAKQIINKLDSIYQRKSLTTQISLRKRLLNLKLNGESLSNHFMTFENLLSDLICAGAKIDEMDKVMHLFLTLPSSYDGVVTALETLQEDKLTLAFVKTRLFDQEVKLNFENKDTSEKVLNVQKINNNEKRENGANVLHTFRKNKFNVNNKRYKFNNQKTNYKYNMNARKCLHCGKSGHLLKNCFLYKKQFKKTENETVNVTQKEITHSIFMADSQIISSNQLTFIADSGASDHIINDEALYESCEELKTPVMISVAKKNVYIKATKIGRVRLISSSGHIILLKDVFLCDEVPNNLISVKRMALAGFKIIIDDLGLQVRNKNNQIILKGNNENNVYKISLQIKKEINSALNDEYLLWHRRLGHIGRDKFLEIKRKELFSDISKLNNVVPNNFLCEACIKGKQARLPYQKAKDKIYIDRPLFIVHTDVCGPVTPTTVDEKNYFVIYVDAYTHYLVTYLISRKSDVFSTFKDFVGKATSHFNLKIVHLYADNGREYLSTEMKDFCIINGISYHLTIPYSPQLNGVSERMIRTITEKARALIHVACLDESFWGEAVLTATFLINLSPSKAIKQSKTPWELWHKRKPTLKYLKVFGATVYVHNKIRTSKFQEKVWKGILIGYQPNGYKVWNVELAKFIVARDVTVDESSYMISRPNIQSNKNVPEIMGKRKFDQDVSNGESREEITNNDNVKSDISDEFENISKDYDNTSVEKIVTRDIENKLRRSKRIRQQEPVSYDESKNWGMCAMYNLDDVPSSFEEIKNRSDKAYWEEAIKDELNSHMINKTWSLVKKPINKNYIDCRWVFTTKNDDLGNVIKYKARVVARGFSQEYMVDYTETFAPVAKIVSFRFMLAFANQNKLLVHHMDVKTAFLNGDLAEEIYMTVPEGLVCKSNQICKLKLDLNNNFIS